MARTVVSLERSVFGQLTQLRAGLYEHIQHDETLCTDVARELVVVQTFVSSQRGKIFACSHDVQDRLGNVRVNLRELCAELLDIDREVLIGIFDPVVQVRELVKQLLPLGRVRVGARSRGVEVHVQRVFRQAAMSSCEEMGRMR